jgi:Icc-related predicted phosphoesterase
MFFQLASDLHIDFIRDWQDMVHYYIITCRNECETLILPGDLCEAHDNKWVNCLNLLAEHYKTVLVVLGNHEHYNTRHIVLERQIALLKPNVRVLRRQVIEIEGFTFTGSTLWYPKRYLPEHKKQIGDFYSIEGSEAWILDQNRQDIEFFRSVSADVFITHHLPSYLSNHPRFVGSCLTPFFVCDIEDIIKERQPRAVVHGHSHDKTQYKLGNTSIYCNPRGYRYEDRYKRFELQTIELTK